MKRTTLYVLAVLIVLLSVAPSYAAVYNINGTISRADTMAGLSGVTVANGSNTTTTNATGFYSIPNMSNNTAGWVITVTAPNDGYSSATINAIVNAADNTSAHANLSLVTPSISGITETSVGRTSATISWTPNISTIGNRLIYTRDSGLANNLVTSSWSNSTTAPSFVLSGLDIYTTYYYQLQSYNTNNESYSTTSNGDFKTLAGNPEEEPENYEAVVSAATTGQQSAPASVVTQVQSQATKSQTNKVIAFVLIVLILYLVLGGKKKK